MGGAGIGVAGWRLNHEGFQRPWSLSVIISGCNNRCGNFLNARRSPAGTCFPSLMEPWPQPGRLAYPWGLGSPRPTKAILLETPSTALERLCWGFPLAAPSPARSLC